jgi:hypothetical protein
LGLRWSRKTDSRCAFHLSRASGHVHCHEIKDGSTCRRFRSDPLHSYMSPSVSSTGSGDFIHVHLIYHTFIHTLSRLPLFQDYLGIGSDVRLFQRISQGLKKPFPASDERKPRYITCVMVQWVFQFPIYRLTPISVRASPSITSGAVPK